MSERGARSAPETKSLSRSLGFRETVVELGMLHPALRRVLSTSGGSLGFTLSLDDERIRAVDVEIGLGHRGFEKEVESRDWSLALPYVSRLGYVGGVQHECGYCGAVEALAGIELPERVVWVRTLACELARVADHFARLAGVAAALGVPVAETWAQDGGVHAARALARATGTPPLAGWARPGGVATAPPSDLAALWAPARRAIEASLAGYAAAGLRNPGFDRRLREVGVADAEQCLAWSVTGPAQRAAGTPVDLRQDPALLAYASVDFDIPVGEQGDAYDRVQVVAEEIRQSLRIVDQCAETLDGLGPGAFEIDGGAEGLAVPAGAAAFSLESSTGELGFFVVSDGEGPPRRIRCRAPSFFHAQALPALLVDEMLDDLLMIVATLHILSPEVDR